MSTHNPIAYYYEIPALADECNKLLVLLRERKSAMEVLCEMGPSQGVARSSDSHSGSPSNPTPAALAVLEQERRELRHDHEYVHICSEIKQLECDLSRYGIDTLQIRFAMQRLTHRQREIVEAKYRDKRTVESIGESLSIDDRTVRYHLSQAVMVVKRHLRLAMSAKPR